MTGHQDNTEQKENARPLIRLRFLAGARGVEFENKKNVVNFKYRTI